VKSSVTNCNGMKMATRRLLMKETCLKTLIALASLGLCLHCYSQSVSGTFYSDDYVHHLGIGAQLGSPIGVNAKYWLSDACAVDGAFGLSPYSHSSVEFHADFLAHNFDLFTLNSGKMPVYIGGGILARFRNDGHSDMAGFRFPLGISYMFEDVPIDIFAEIAPEIIVTPFRRGYLDGSVGIRFWF
jgi:hypothetical protein